MIFFRTRLVAVATQKFVAEVAGDALFSMLILLVFLVESLPSSFYFIFSLKVLNFLQKLVHACERS